MHHPACIGQFPRIWGTIENIWRLRRPVSVKQIKEALERCTPRAGKPPSERFNIGYGEPIPIPLVFFVFLSSWVAFLGWGFNPSKQNYMGLWDPVIRILEFGMEDDYGSNHKPRMIHKCVVYRDKGGNITQRQLGL